MKKQKQVTIKPSLFGDTAKQHVMKQISPPDQAKKNGLTGGYDIDKAKAAQIWFQTAKSAEGTDQFLGVSKETLDPVATLDREKLPLKKKSE